MKNQVLENKNTFKFFEYWKSLQKFENHILPEKKSLTPQDFKGLLKTFFLFEQNENGEITIN